MGPNAQTFHHTGHRETRSKSRQPSPVSLCAPSVLSVVKPLLACSVPESSQDQSTVSLLANLPTDASVRPDDSPDIACCGVLGPRLLFLRFDHIEILVSSSRVKEHDPIFGSKEAAGAQLLMGNQ
jgi:hypothetical protein